MWQHVFDQFNDLKVCIIGDMMLDSYVWGQVERISPEAPVPIVRVQKRENRLGGAANVALNVQALGAEARLFSVVGDDAEGRELVKILQDRQLPHQGIVQSANRPTTVKQRIIAHSQHVVRIDAETEQNINDAEQTELVARIKEQPRPDVIIFEDYDKGVLNQSLIQEVIAWAKSLDIPTITDPKKRNFLHYTGVTLFKPNLKELREGLKMDLDTSTSATIQEAVEKAKNQLGVEGILLTLSEKGIFIQLKGKSQHLLAHVRQIADVSGAGDTVVSIAALCLALNIEPQQIAALANLGGGLVCEDVGVVPINKDKLLAEAMLLAP